MLRRKSNLFIFLLMGVMMLGFGSSLEIDNVRDEIPITKGQSFLIGEKVIPYNDLWEKYPNMEIKNAFGLGQTLFRGSLVDHTESCLEDCSSIIEVELANDGPLIQDIEFRTQLDDGSWEPQEVRNYKIEYYNPGKTILIEDYENQCSVVGKYPNGTNQEVCESVLIGTREVPAPDWTLYSIGESLPAGNYRVRIEAEKSIMRTVDWIIKTNGEWLEEWAVWGGAFSGSEYQISIIADNVDSLGGDLVVTELSDGVWKVNTTNADDEVSRALIMEMLFYGTTGSNPRAENQTYIQNVTTIYSRDARDADKRGIYASVAKATSVQGNWDCTFSDTTSVPLSLFTK